MYSRTVNKHSPAADKESINIRWLTFKNAQNKLKPGEKYDNHCVYKFSVKK